MLTACEEEILELMGVGEDEVWEITPEASNEAGTDSTTN